MFLPERRLEPRPEDAPTVRHYALWLLLSSLPSGFLLTVTNFIALEVGSFPMVWVFPLALYLGSFVVTFRNNGGVPKVLGGIWPEIAITGILLYFIPTRSLLGIITPLLVLITVCLVAHGELYERRPQVNFLTHYYLTMALGGFLGGAVVTLLAPSLFPGLYEYPIILAGLILTLLGCRWTSLLPSFHNHRSFLMIRSVVIGVLLGFIGIFSIFQSNILGSTCKFRHRNFYGIYRIMDIPPTKDSPGGLRQMMHGNTLHGSQLLASDQRHTPIAYYYKGGPIAEVYETMPSPRRIAVIGLGAGVLSAYTRPNDTLTYFEIDPDNEKIARTWFTYLDCAAARVSIINGDGRLSMNEMPKDIIFDIITIDAFTGDGIPTHLLTMEAMQGYLNRLAKNGIILFHISNRYYDLKPVMKSTSRQLKLYGAMNTQVSQAKLPPNGAASECVVLALDPVALKPFLARGWVPFGEGDGLDESAPWTDDYINILHPLWARLWGTKPISSSRLQTAARSGN